MKTRIRDLYQATQDYVGKEVTVYGWVRNNRSQKEFGFLDLNDGTTFETMQVVYDSQMNGFSDARGLRTAAAVSVQGLLVLTPDR